MKAYVKISEAICKDPECCGGEDYPVAVTLIKEIADEWKKGTDVHVEEFELTEELPSARIKTEEGFMGRQRMYENDPK